MKRSEIDAIIDDAKDFFGQYQFLLPEWAGWSLDELRDRKAECAEIFDRKLGWDITDFATGEFDKCGLVLFTVRNGDPQAAGQTYCEKIMIVGENQETPYHYHADKVEDIINRGGGVLMLQLYSKAPGGGLGTEPLSVGIDGVRRTIASGDMVELHPGQSIRLERTVFHRFFGKEGCGKVLVGEVSSVNDDEGDNHFLEAPGRWAGIDEDAPARNATVMDY